MIRITTSDSTLLEQAKTIAQQWNFTFSNTVPPQEKFFLQLSNQGLQLIQSSSLPTGPIFTNFSSGQIAHRRLFGGGKSQTIAKAVGLNKKTDLIILDGTAGMGKDAFVFASLGAKVIMVERSPIAAALLSDALQRALLEEDIVHIMKRMSLIHEDVKSLSLNKNNLLTELPDIVYLDPMFPHRKKSALVKKEMLAFQILIGEDNDSDELLQSSLQLAQKRVVVKRPIKAPYLDNKKPSLSMTMKKHRFDIYLKP